MKRMLAIVLAAVMALSLVACAGGAANPSAPAQQGGSNETAAQQTTGGELAGTYDITVWCADKVVDLTKKQIADFNAKNTDGITINATVEPVGEGDAATQMITDVEAGADIYCFAQDQFARLVQANALSKLGATAAENVKANNAAGTVEAVTSGDELFAYPMTADNLYFMYYDKSVIPEEDVGSLEKLIADCEAANKYFAFQIEDSGWYMAGWFFGTGCVSKWETDSDGNFISVNDTFDSPEGLIAAKGMNKLMTSPMFLNASSAQELDSGAAIVVSGTWDSGTAKGILGDNLGVAELPSFEVDGQSYHIGAFNGYKLVGVKPQTDAVKGAVLHKLAQYLTSAEAQVERFEAVGWGPANLTAAASEAVQADPILSAVAAQAVYAVPQGQVHGQWWDITKPLGAAIKTATSDAELQKALDDYKAAIAATFNMTEEDKLSWSVIGMYNEADGFFFTDYNNETRSNWNDDLAMVKVEEGIWKTEKAYEIPEGCEFKCRQAKGWDNAFPADNFKVEAAGTYYIQLNETSGEITLIPA